MVFLSELYRNRKTLKLKEIEFERYLNIGLRYWSQGCMLGFETNRLLCLLTAADSFKLRDFFGKVGLAAKSGDDIKKAFAIIDQDKSGFIEEDELK